MSWSRLLRPALMAGLLLGAGLALGACSFSPVYSDSGRLAQQSAALNLAYAKPSGRLEQLIYQELALRFGTSQASDARLVMVTASVSHATVGMSRTDNPNKAHRATVTAVLNIPAGNGAEALRLTRRASADYTTSGQVLADQAAAIDAAERAARAAAESLRLGLLAALSRG